MAFEYHSSSDFEWGICVRLIRVATLLELGHVSVPPEKINNKYYFRLENFPETLNFVKFF